MNIRLRFKPKMDMACMLAAYSDTGRRQEKTTFIRLLLSRLIHQPMYWRGGGLAAAELQGGGISCDEGDLLCPANLPKRSALSALAFLKAPAQTTSAR